MDKDRIEVTAAELRGPTEHSRGTLNGSLVEIEGRPWHVTRHASKPTGMLDIDFKEVDGANRVLRQNDVLPKTKFTLLRERDREERPENS